MLLSAKFIAGDGRAFIGVCASRSGADEVEVYEPNEATIDHQSDTLRTQEGTEPIVFRDFAPLAEFLYGDDPLLNLKYDCDSAVLRNWVYRWIQDDFRRSVLETLKKPHLK